MDAEKLAYYRRDCLEAAIRSFGEPTPTDIAVSAILARASDFTNFVLAEPVEAPGTIAVLDETFLVRFTEDELRARLAEIERDKPQVVASEVRS